MLASEYQIAGWLPGTPGVQFERITDFIVPGRALTPDGNGVELGTEMRVYAAGNHLASLGVLERGGLVVCSANRMPAAAGIGDPWEDPVSHEPFPFGLPEAEGLRRAAVDTLGIPDANVIKQQHSFETVGDIWLGQEALLRALDAQGIDLEEYRRTRVVAIAAQYKHLKSIMEDVTPQVMRIPVVGAIVPEVYPRHPDHYPLPTRPIRRYVAHGLAHVEPTQEVTNRIFSRANRVWRAKLGIDNLLHRDTPNMGTTSTETSPANDEQVAKGPPAYSEFLRSALEYARTSTPSRP